MRMCKHHCGFYITIVVVGTKAIFERKNFNTLETRHTNVMVVVSRSADYFDRVHFSFCFSVLFFSLDFMFIFRYRFHYNWYYESWLERNRPIELDPKLNRKKKTENHMFDRGPAIKSSFQPILLSFSLAFSFAALWLSLSLWRPQQRRQTAKLRVCIDEHDSSVSACLCVCVDVRICIVFVGRPRTANRRRD